MNKKLPEIFRNPNITKEGNNKNAFYSFKDNRSIREDNRNYSNIELEDIGLYFNRTVEITTNANTITTKIVSKLNNHLLTNTNQKIDISTIISIRPK